MSDLIEKYLTPTEFEKKNNAEISTPKILAIEMIEKIFLGDIDFFKTPKKVFDPCCGKGIFCILIFEYFFEGLKEFEPDEELRIILILEKCLYFNDLNPLNRYITCLLLDSENKYNLNCDQGIEEIDTLKIEFNFKFDLVIGNPPYNHGIVGTGNTLWQFFVKRSLNYWLEENGFLIFVHPSGWRKPTTEKCKFYKLFELMVHKNDMIFLSINDTKKGIEIFKCGTRFDYYIIRKNNTNELKTKIICNNEIFLSNLKNKNFLSNSKIDLMEKIIINNSSDKSLEILCNFNYSRQNKKNVSINKTEIFKYPLIYLTPKKGIRYYWSNTMKKGHFGISKVIIGETGMDNSINDFDGNYGMTQDSFGINNFIKFIKESCSWSNFRIDWRLFKYFKQDFYKEFI